MVHAAILHPDLHRPRPRSSTGSESIDFEMTANLSTPTKRSCRAPPTKQRRRPSGGDSSTASPPTAKDLVDLEARIRAASVALASLQGSRDNYARHKLLSTVLAKRRRRWHDMTAALRMAKAAATPAKPATADVTRARPAHTVEAASARAATAAPDASSTHACPTGEEADPDGDATGMCHACGQKCCGECNHEAVRVRS